MAPTVKSTKSTGAKCSKLSISTRPIKSALSTLSTTKKLSAVSRPTLIKQTSACDLRERLQLNQDDDILNTGFTSSSLSAKIESGAAKNMFSTFSAINPAAKRLFGNSTPTTDRSVSWAVLSTPDCFSKVLLDTQTPQRCKKSWETPQSARKSAETSDDSKSKENSEVSNLTVAVRIRPMNAKECTTPSVRRVVSVKSANEILVKSGANVDTLTYDNVLSSYDLDDTANYADQETVFNGTALPLIDKAFEGYNACLFAYGQTGNGKSYSMMGTDTDDDHSKPNREAGIIPRFCHELFNRIDRMKGKFSAEVEVSYFEIYNEKIRDLLAVASTHLPSVTPGSQVNRQALQIREHPQWGPYIENLNIHPVASNVALKNWMAVGNSQRAIAATGMNDRSSRSHSIFSIILTLSELDSESSKLNTKRSRINLVDLAGSERVSQTCASGERLKEGVSINRSLLTLGRVINALADPKKNTFAPHRESVLTWLLKESLGGNSKTVMLATISPASLQMDETLATLRYACQARAIVNRVKVNEYSNNREIDRLRAQVQFYKRQEIEAPPRKIVIETYDTTPKKEEEKEKLRQQLKEKEKELANAEKSWRERLREADNKCKNEMKLLQQNGLALQLSAAQKQPCLINLATDPMLSGTLLYILPPGIVRIGQPKPPTHAQSDIVLDGPLVGLDHCEIDNRDGKLFIQPDMDDCETFVNGELIRGEREIYDGDRIVIGGSHYFRVSNPHCSRRAQTNVVDYHTAHQEISREQEKRLRLEMMVEQQAATWQIEGKRAKHDLNLNEKVTDLNKCSEEMIDLEKEVLSGKQEEDTALEYRPFESDLCEKIERIIERPTEEGMHETQLMVKEATQRCRRLGLDYEFVQTLVADGSDVLKTVVKIVDWRSNRFAEWPTARLSVWLNLMRDTSEATAENAFESLDISWCDDIQKLKINKFLSSSRVSLNLSAIGELRLSKIFYSCFKNIQNKQEMSTSSSNLTGFSANTLKCWESIETSVGILCEFDDLIGEINNNIQPHNLKDTKNKLMDYKKQLTDFEKDLGEKIVKKLDRAINKYETLRKTLKLNEPGPIQSQDPCDFESKGQVGEKHIFNALKREFMVIKTFVTGLTAKVQRPSYSEENDRILLGLKDQLNFQDSTLKETLQTIQSGLDKIQELEDNDAADENR